jgi:uncharacterized protein with PIN domain
MADPLLLDGTLGRLARWLRLAGYDAASVEGDELEVFRAAHQTGRLLLTRNTAFRRRRSIAVLLIDARELADQLALVSATLGPPPGAGPRCAVCNTVLLPVTPASVEGKVPSYILRTAESFARCPSCHRIYWKGSHWDEIEKKLPDQLD